MLHKTFLLAIILLVSVSVCRGQSKATRIEFIRKCVKRINQDSALKKETIQNEELPGPDYDNGQSLTAYFKNDTIYEIHLSIGLSYCMKEIYYYFNINRLIFIHEIEDDYPYEKSTGSLNYNKLVQSFEGRYYLKHGAIIYAKANGKKRFSEESEINHLINDVQSYKKLVEHKLKK